jgi:hypothetical protein
VLHVLFIKAQSLGELKRMFHVTGSVHGMKRTDKSPHKLLLSCDASYSERGTKKKRSALEYPNIPSVIRPVPHCEGLLIPETHF